MFRVSLGVRVSPVVGISAVALSWRTHAVMYLSDINYKRTKTRKSEEIRRTALRIFLPSFDVRAPCDAIFVSTAISWLNISLPIHVRWQEFRRVRTGNFEFETNSDLVENL